mgnify:CR=1 FL=1
MQRQTLHLQENYNEKQIDRFKSLHMKRNVTKMAGTPFQLRSFSFP